MHIKRIRVVVGSNRLMVLNGGCVVVTRVILCSCLLLNFWPGLLLENSAEQDGIEGECEVVG